MPRKYPAESHVEPSVAPSRAKDEAERRHHQPGLQATPPASTPDDRYRAILEAIKGIRSEIAATRRLIQSESETLRMGVFDHLTVLLGEIQQILVAGLDVESLEGLSAVLHSEDGGKVLEGGTPPSSGQVADRQITRKEFIRKFGQLPDTQDI